MLYYVFTKLLLTFIVFYACIAFVLYKLNVTALSFVWELAPRILTVAVIVYVAVQIISSIILKILEINEDKKSGK